MPIDPSIALNVKPTQALANPFEQAGQVANLQNALLTNRVNNQALSANQATSEAIKGATDPNTGQVDWGKAQGTISQGPGAYNLPQFAAQVQQQKNAQLDNQVKQLEYATKRQGAAANLVGGLLTNPKFGKADLSGEVISSVQNGLQSGVFGDPGDPESTKAAARYIAELPSDPQQQAVWLKNHYLTAADGFQKLSSLLPQNQTIDSGGSVNVFNRDPITGQLTQTTQVNKSLTPGELSSNVEVIDPNTGAKGVITKARQLGINGPGNSGSGYTGRYDSGQGGDQGGFTPTGLSPAAQSAQSSAGANAATASQGLSNEVNGAPVRINSLQEARDKLANIDTGKGAASFNEAKQYIATNPLLTDIAQKAGLDINKVNNFAEFNKIVTQYANQTSAGLGTGTNDRLNATIAGNANTNMPNAANKYVLTKAIAAEQYRSALNDAWQNSGNSPEKFNQFLSQWNKNVPVEVFAYNAMSPEQRAEYQAKLQKTGGLDKFRTQYNAIHAQGLLGQ